MARETFSQTFLVFNLMIKTRANDFYETTFNQKLTLSLDRESYEVTDRETYPT